MAQRRMSRKSFRRSKGRKTRSMRKRTMGGEDLVVPDTKSVLENVKTENTAAYSERMRTIGKCTKNFGYKNSKDRTDANNCELYKMADLALQGKMTEADKKAIGVKLQEKGPDRKATGRYFSPYLSVQDYLVKRAERAERAKTATTTTTETEPATEPEPEPEPAPEPAPAAEAAPAAPVEDSKPTVRKALEELKRVFIDYSNKYEEGKNDKAFNPGYPEEVKKKFFDLFYNMSKLGTNLNNFVKINSDIHSPFKPVNDYNRMALFLNKFLEKKDMPTLEQKHSYLGDSKQDQGVHWNDNIELDYENSIVKEADVNLDADFTFPKRGGRKTRRRRNKKSRKTRRR